MKGHCLHESQVLESDLDICPQVFHIGLNGLSKSLEFKFTEWKPGESCFLVVRLRRTELVGGHEFWNQ